MAKLYVTLAIFCVFGAVLVRGFDKKAAMEEFMKKADKCKADVGAKESDITEIVEKKPASSMEGKCLRSCLMKAYDAMDSNGKLVKDIALKHADNYVGGNAEKMKIANEIIDVCTSLSVSGDHCEAAEEYAKCFKTQAAAHNVEEDFDY